MDLQIHIGFGQLGIKYPNNEFTFKTPIADFDIQQTPAQLELSKPQAEVAVDYTPTWQSLGIYDFVTLEKQSAQKGMMLSQEGTARRAQEGDTLGRIENKGTKISQIAWQGSQDPDRELSIASLLPPRIETNIRTTPSRYMPAKVEVTSPWAMVQFQAKVGLLDVYVEKKPYVKVEAVGSLVDMIA